MVVKVLPAQKTRRKTVLIREMGNKTAAARTANVPSVVALKTSRASPQREERRRE